MTYVIRRYENTTTSTAKSNIIVNDNTINTDSTSLSLIGAFTENYISHVAENFIWTNENFFSTDPPNNAIIGQLWFNNDPDPDKKGLYYWDGPDPTNGGNSLLSANWKSLTNKLSDELAEHIATVSPQNPHIDYRV